MVETLNSERYILGKQREAKWQYDFKNEQIQKSMLIFFCIIIIILSKLLFYKLKHYFNLNM